MELFHASHQWASRPADQRFKSLAELYAVTREYANQAGEATVTWRDLRVEAVGDDLNLHGSAGVPARVTHYAFGQLAQRAGAPASYLRALPSTLAAMNLNYGLKEKSDDTRAQLLFHTNAGLLLRAATSDSYARIWNWEVVERLIDASAKFNLVPARSTFRTFDPENPPALYASDHDLFAFVMTQDRSIQDPQGEPLYRGVIAINSEVGAASLKLQSFLFRDICGNHIIWGAKDLTEIRLAHVGQVRERWAEAQVEIRKYLDSGSGFEEASLAKAATVTLGGTKDDVLDAIFGLKGKPLGSISRKTIAAGYDAVVEDEDGPANTVWGLAQGLTRYSQTIPYADERQQVDRAAGKLLTVTF
jgi:hypothetical protein